RSFAGRLLLYWETACPQAVQRKCHRTLLPGTRACRLQYSEHQIVNDTAMPLVFDAGVAIPHGDGLPSGRWDKTPPDAGPFPPGTRACRLQLSEHQIMNDTAIGPVFDALNQASAYRVLFDVRPFL